MKSKNSVEEKFELVVESLTESIRILTEQEKT